MVDSASFAEKWTSQERFYPKIPKFQTDLGYQKSISHSIQILQHTFCSPYIILQEITLLHSNLTHLPPQNYRFPPKMSFLTTFSQISRRELHQTLNKCIPVMPQLICIQPYQNLKDDFLTFLKSLFRSQDGLCSYRNFQSLSHNSNFITFYHFFFQTLRVFFGNLPTSFLCPWKGCVISHHRNKTQNTSRSA